MLRYQSISDTGDFIAHGLGLRYEYDRHKHALKISTLRSDTGLFSLLCPARMSENPLLLVHNLEKAGCIKALMLSDNETANLAQTMNECRLKPILQSVFELAIESFDLAHGDFDSFTTRKTMAYGLEDFQIKHMQCTRSGTSYYRLFVKIGDTQDVVIRDTEFDTLLTKSAKTIVRDLIPHTFSSSNRETGDKLLMLSSRLSLLGRILNENYSPELQVKDKKSFSQTA